MFTALLTSVLPGAFLQTPRRTIADRYDLYLSQHAAHHHFDSLCLAVGVLEHTTETSDSAEWLLRVEEAADKCAVAVEDCVSKSE